MPTYTPMQALDRIKALEAALRDAHHIIDVVMGDTDPPDDDDPLLLAAQGIIAALDGDLAGGLTLDKTDADLVRQWFNSVQDLSPKYLERSDFLLGARITEHCGGRVAHSVLRGAGLPIPD
jgi:hypothetical protein